MTEPSSAPAGGRSQLESAFAALAEEQRRLDEFQRRMREATTTVESANKMLTATFDGRGELVRLTFNNVRYRTMAPKELASAVTETLQRGRQAAIDKIGEMAGGDVLPGVAFGDLAAGRVDINDVVGAVMTSALDLPSIVRAAQNERGAANGQ